MDHIIRRQLLELTLDGSQPPFNLQNRLKEEYYHTLLPILEEWFSRLAGEEEVLHIDTLVLDLGLFSSKEFNDEELKQRLIKKLHSPDTTISLRTTNGHTSPTRPGSTGHNPPTRLRSAGHNAFEQWLWYMEKGYLPWNLLRPDKEWEKKVLETLATDHAAISRLRTMLAGHPVAPARIARQHDDIFLTRLTEILTTVTQTTLSQTLQELRQLLAYGSRFETSHIPSQERIWQDTLSLAAALGKEGTTLKLGHRILSSYLANHQTSAPAIHPSGSPSSEETRSYTVPPSQTEPSLINKQTGTKDRTPQDPQDRLTNPATPLKASATSPKAPATSPKAPATPIKTQTTPIKIPTTPPKAQTTPPKAQTETNVQPGTTETPAPPDQFAIDQLPEEGIFLLNAGVILIHPFLNHLFKQVGLIANGRFIAGEARQKAIHLIHYLATGRIIAEEFELATAKIICGCPLEEPMERTVVYTEEELKEADSLLEGCVAHWGVKGVTIEGLRGNFLTRSGKLIPKAPDKLQLVIEQHAVDILIRTYPFPWNMNIIKLPWLRQPIHLEW